MPYLFFDGRCERGPSSSIKKRSARKWRCSVRFKDSPEPEHNAPGSDNKVMHARLRIGKAVVMLSDGHCKGNPTFEGFSLSLTVAGEADADRYFNALADGGKIQMPLGKTFFSPRFGMVADRFGVLWMILVESR